MVLPILAHYLRVYQAKCLCDFLQIIRRLVKDLSEFLQIIREFAKCL
jgi:hypothetical protein